MESLIVPFFLAASRSRANGRMDDGTDWAWRRGVDGSTGANGRAVSKVVTASGKVSRPPHGTRARGQVASRTATDRKHTQMEVSNNNYYY